MKQPMQHPLNQLFRFMIFRFFCLHLGIGMRIPNDPNCPMPCYSDGRPVTRGNQRPLL